VLYDQMEAMKAATIEPTEEKGPNKFDPIASPEWWHAVTNVFESIRSSLNPQISLRYVIRPEVPEDYQPIDEEDRKLHQIPLEGPAFRNDNRRVWTKLEALTTGTDAAGYIEPYRGQMDGRKAALALVAHYLGTGAHYLGTGASDARVNIATGILEGLHYKNESVFPWEKFITRFTKCFNILDASDDEALTPKQKVDKLFEKIQTSDKKLLAAAAVVQNKYPRDFAAAATEMGAHISVLYKTIQAKRSDQSTGYRKRQVSATDSSRSAKFQRGGGGPGRGAGWNGRGGGNRYGGRGGGAVVATAMEMVTPMRLLMVSMCQIHTEPSHRTK